MPSYVVTSPLVSGCYTQKALQFVIGPNTPCIFELELTGEEIATLARTLVEGGGQMAVIPFSPETLPVTSGFELHVLPMADGSYVLDGVTVGGEPLDPAHTYKMAYVDNTSIAKVVCNAAFGKDTKELPAHSATARVTWVNYILEGNAPAEPTSYITLG